MLDKQRFTVLFNLRVWRNIVRVNTENCVKLFSVKLLKFKKIVSQQHSFKTFHKNNKANLEIFENLPNLKKRKIRTYKKLIQTYKRKEEEYVTY